MKVPQGVIFTTKKDSDGYACLQVIKKMYEKNIIDKFLNVIIAE
jgi:oligoribonuclease NrnB/cAMP/cGMP phosphodiesterase (DHH superfamily)